jgi:hypothetical protein
MLQFCCLYTVCCSAAAYNCSCRYSCCWCCDTTSLTANIDVFNAAQTNDCLVSTSSVVLVIQKSQRGMIWTKRVNTSHPITWRSSVTYPCHDTSSPRNLSPTPLWYPMDYPWQLYSVSDVTATSLTAASLTAAEAAGRTWLPRWTRGQWRCPPSPSYTRKPFPIQTRTRPRIELAAPYPNFGMWGPRDYLTVFHRNFSTKIFLIWTQKMHALRTSCT